VSICVASHAYTYVFYKCVCVCAYCEHIPSLATSGTRRHKAVQPYFCRATEFSLSLTAVGTATSMLITSNNHPSDWYSSPVKPFSNILFSLCLHHSQLVILLMWLCLTHTIIYQHIVAKQHEGCFGQKQTTVLCIVRPASLAAWESGRP